MHIFYIHFVTIVPNKMLVMWLKHTYSRRCKGYRIAIFECNMQAKMRNYYSKLRDDSFLSSFFIQKLI